MCLYILLCTVLLTLCQHVYGNMSSDMSKAIQLCCNVGTGFAKNNTLESCSAIQPIPSGVPESFGSLCIMARTQCCKEYFQKKQDCETGIDIAINSRHCDATKGSAKICCNDCVKGEAIGHIQGHKICSSRPHGTNTEELLSDEAFVRCCKRAAQEKTEKSISRQAVGKSKRSDTVASICEEYAPNELCAHHCIPIPGSYRCECNPGFKLMADGRNCIAVVKNRCKPKNSCQHKCNDNGVEVKCSCRRGYQLMPDGKSCQDIDECLLDLPVCLPGTKCYNIQGSYKCIPTNGPNKVEKKPCPPGFSRSFNSNLCDDINECKLPNPPCPPNVCVNTIGAYKCDGITGDPNNLANIPRAPVEERCPPGFKLGLKGECEDVDECEIHKDDCNVLSQFCINTHGSFHCQNKISKHCPPGFKIDSGTGKCEDIDECEDVSDLCRQDQVCVNQLGQYDCKQKEDPTTAKSKLECPVGMRMNSGVCEDINECAEGTHICDMHQNCLNTNGSYECHCKIGYELDITTEACVDVNECATGQHSCIIGSQRCDNTVGSFLCIRITSCGTGYILDYSTGNCEDIDECALGIHNCFRAGPQYHCTNLPGSFRCVRRLTTTTSTSTTAAPLDYEIDYYYSEEENPEGNETIPESPSKPKESTVSSSAATTTTNSPLPTSEKLPPLVTTTEKIPQQSEKPEDKTNFVPYDKLREGNNVIPVIPESSQTTLTDYNIETTKKNGLEIRTEQTKIMESASIGVKEELPTTSEEPIITYNEPKFNETSKFDPSIPEYVPYVPEYVPYVPESTATEAKHTTAQETDIPNTIDVLPDTEKSETTYRPQDEKTSPRYPQTVDENDIDVPTKGVNNASITTDSTEKTQNNWPKINITPVACPIGFENDEYGACFDIDECATNRHSCSGLTETCRNTIGGYVCDCAPGFRKDLNKGFCEYITTSPSTTTSTTTTTTTTLPPPTTSTSERSKSFFWGYPDYRQLTTRPFRPRSQCDAGYHLNSQTGKCEDVNECTNGQANCAEVEICVNTAGGYRCECPPNWRLDEIRHRCIPVRSNGQFPPGYGNVPTYQPTTGKNEGGYEFKVTKIPSKITPDYRGFAPICKNGFRLGDDNTCQDIDECLTGEAKCGPLQICMNLLGGYACGCPPGYKQVKDHECQDVNECSLAGNTPICSKNADCVNTMGSYQCKCHRGFRSAPVNDKVCVNVDECAESRPGSLCEQRCNDVWGSYRCSCHRGYRLNNFDNRTCSDINECVDFKQKILCVGQCMNVPGSYRCACPSGYRLAEDKRSCIDIDECATGEAACAKIGVIGDTSNICVNTRGSYRCHRITCPMGYKLEGKHRCNKVDRDCKPGDYNCAHQASTISYNYITFVSNLYIPDDKVKLFTMRGPTWVYAKINFRLLLVDVNAPPNVKDRADVNAFVLQQGKNEAVVSLVRPLDGPQSIELELSMHLYNGKEFGGIAVARLFIHVSEYDF